MSAVIEEVRPLSGGIAVYSFSANRHASYYTIRLGNGCYIVQKLGTTTIYSVRLGDFATCECPAYCQDSGRDCRHIQIVKKIELSKI